MLHGASGTGGARARRRCFSLPISTSRAPVRPCGCCSIGISSQALDTTTIITMPSCAMQSTWGGQQRRRVGLYLRCCIRAKRGPCRRAMCRQASYWVTYMPGVAIHCGVCIPDSKASADRRGTRSCLRLDLRLQLQGHHRGARVRAV